jgi:hypothetical protein
LTFSCKTLQGICVIREGNIVNVDESCLSEEASFSVCGEKERLCPRSEFVGSNYFKRNDGEDLSRIRRASSICSYDAKWSLSSLLLKNKTALFRFGGRMCNMMIQYLYARIFADAHGYGVTVVHDFGLLKDFPNVTFSSAVDRSIAPVECGFYHQNYLYYKDFRNLAWNIFLHQDSRDIIPNTVCLHFRVLEVSYQDDQIGHPPLSYYTSILDQYSFNTTKIWIITEPALINHTIVHELVSRYSASIHGKAPSEDWLLGIRAETFIGSEGTFSWTIAYFSVGRRIFLPFSQTTCQGSSWFPLHQMFIHDDHRILYHATEAPTQSMTADQVMMKQSEFAKCVQTRTDYCAP